jgi:hypothetical protein
MGGKDSLGDDEWQRDKAYLRLLLLLEEANSPVYPYDAIIAWLSFTPNICGNDFFEKAHPKRDSFLESYWKYMRYPRAQSIPVPIEYPVPNI